MIHQENQKIMFARLFSEQLDVLAGLNVLERLVLKASVVEGKDDSKIAEAFKIPSRIVNYIIKSAITIFKAPREAALSAAILGMDPGQYEMAVRLPSNHDPISDREKDVLACIMKEINKGKEIAEELHIAESTVKNHLKKLFRKTGAKNVSELFVMTWKPLKP